MRKVILASLAGASLITTAAHAADLATYKAPPPPPALTWTGLYAGLNLGGDIGTNTGTSATTLGPVYNMGYSQTRPGGSSSQAVTNNAAALLLASGLGSALSSSNIPGAQSGLLGGGQIGYNWQATEKFVLGVETDFQGATINGGGTRSGVGAGATGWAGLGPTTEPFSPFAPVAAVPGQSYTTTSAGYTSVNAGVKWLGTVRGRLGYLLTPTLLMYGTAGLTYGNVYASIQQTAVSNQAYYQAPNGDGVFNAAPTATATQWLSSYGNGQSYSNQNRTLIGYNVGGGLEWKFLQNWSLKGEALYWNLGNMNASSLTAGPATSLTGGTMSSSNVRVNYQGIIARLGVNYHLNWPAPAAVIAKY